MTVGVGGSTAEAELAAMKNMRGDVPPIGVEERLQRIARAQAIMREKGIDALYLDVSSSMTYFTGLKFRRTERMHSAVLPAKGEIVFTLDNDVLFTTPDDVARGVAAFERHPRAAVVNFTILGPDGVLSRRDWCHPRDPDRWADTEFLTDYVLEGASASRDPGAQAVDLRPRRAPRARATDLMTWGAPRCPAGRDTPGALSTTALRS